jgi:hypothetical protein
MKGYPMGGEPRLGKSLPRRSLIRGLLTLLLWVLIVSDPTTVFGSDILKQKEKEYSDCIVRFAPLSPSPQATAILQRACFYKYRFSRYKIDSNGISAEHRKLSKIYTPEVCDCVFDKIPGSNPNVPAPAILKYCIENPRKNQQHPGP